METFIIFPIGGILTFFGIVIVLAVAGMFQGVTSNPDVVMDFVANNTVIFFIIFAVIAIVGFIIAKKETGSILRSILLGVTLFNSLITAYWIVITWVDDFVKSCSEEGIIIFVVCLFIIPLILLCILALVILCLLPNGLLFLAEFFEKEDNKFLTHVLPVIIAVIANSIYLFMIITGLVPML